MRNWLIAAICLIGWFPLLAQQSTQLIPKQSPEQLREDLHTLKKILEANHPSMYWYTPQHQLDSVFNNTLLQIQDSMNEISFKNLVAAYISQIKCGHTTVRNSKSFVKHFSKRPQLSFPLNIKVWDDSLVVINSLNPKDSVFTRGTKIIQINGRTGRQFLDTFSPFISGDGPGTAFACQLVSGNFGGFYRTIIGLDSAYHITYINKQGVRADTLLHNFNPLSINMSAESMAKMKMQRPSRRELRIARREEKRQLRIDSTTQTAYMRLGSFSGSGTAHFIKSSFRKIKNGNVQQLVIDVRTNGGGKVSNSTLLTRYISDHPFRVADSVVRNQKGLEYGSRFQQSWIYALGLVFTSRKQSDGRYHFSRFENKIWQPKEKNHFSGPVYLVQGGYSFSAATLFLGELKGQQNVKLVGEETGGGYYGNSAMMIPICILPNSGLRVSVPLYRLVINKERPKGGGVLPDIYVPPSSEAIRKGVDAKMEKIRSLILQKAAF